MTSKTQGMLVAALLGSVAAVPAAGQAPAPAPAQIAAVTPAPSPVFSGGDLFNISYASDPQVSPDGKRIAYVRDERRRDERSLSAQHLADRHRDRPPGALGRRHWRAPQPALVARRPPPRLCLDLGRARRAIARQVDGWRPGRAYHRASRWPVRHRLVARRPPDRLSDARARRGPEHRQGPAQTRGCDLGRAAAGHRPAAISQRRRRQCPPGL